MNKKHILLNCGNYYNDFALLNIIELLESGESVKIYIDSIGMTRQIIESNVYIRRLKDIYHNRLSVKNSWDNCPVVSLKNKE